LYTAGYSPVEWSQSPEDYASLIPKKSTRDILTPCRIEKKSLSLRLVNRWCKQNIRRSRQRVWGDKRKNKTNRS
jgi:hypothetical protein